MINIRIADVIHAGNRKHKSKIFNFEIENGFFLKKIASFKDLKDELEAVCQVRSRKKCCKAIGIVNGKTQRCKKNPDLLEEGKEVCQEWRVRKRHRMRVRMKLESSWRLD